MKKLIDYFGREDIFSDLLVVFVFFIGLYATLNIKREVFPNVDYEIIRLRAIYPGASAEEIEKLIVSPLERDLKEVDGFKNVNSQSIENIGTIIIQLDADVVTTDEAKSDIQEVVDRFDLPLGAEEIDVSAIDSSLTPVIEVSVSGLKDEIELREVAKKLEDRLEDVSEVARLTTYGIRDYEYKVEASSEKMSKYQVTLSDLIRSIQSQNMTIPGGVIESTNPLSKLSEDIVVRTSGDYEEILDVEQTVLRANALGRSIKVSDVAKVKKSLAKASILSRSNSSRSIVLTVLKKDKFDAIDLVNKVKDVSLKFKTEADDESLKIDFINDTSSYVKRRLSVLTNNFLIGLVLVLFFLSFMLPFKAALITALGIPFAFLATILFFYTQGVGLNLILMMGLIIVVGMLVDDAVVIVENSIRFIEKGHAPREAAILGTQEIWPAVTGSVLTTILAFYPLMIMSGIFGKFVQYIPYGVIVALVFSLYECFFVLPAHIGRWLSDKSFQTKKSKRTLSQTFNVLWLKYIVATYLKVLKQVVRFRYLSVIVCISIIAASLMLAKNKLNFVLFPPDGIELFFIRANAPIGTNLNQTEKLFKPIEDIVSKLPKKEVQDYITMVGVQQQEPNDPMRKVGGHLGQITVYLSPETERSRKVQDIIDDIREDTKSIPNLEVFFAKGNAGPPVGSPISVGLRGDDYKQLDEAADYLKNIIKKMDGATDVDDNYSLGREEVLIDIDQTKASIAGVNVSSVGQTIRAAFEGVVATTIKKQDEEIDVRVLLDKQERKERSSLKNLKVSNNFGNLVPLSGVGNFSKSKGVYILEHEENKRQVKITGDVDSEKTSSAKIAEQISEYIPEIEKKFPGIKVHFGGEDKDTKESMESLFRAFLMAIVLIYFLLILIFKNMYQPFLVLTSIPFGVCGVIWVFFIHQKPLSFMAMLGVVALSGVVINNAIVFIDFVNRARKEGLNSLDSILQAAQYRIRPIFLTTITTVCGILPTAYGFGGLDQFVVPVALALGWGVLFGAVTAVFTIPIAISIQDDLIYLFRKIKPKRSN